MTSVSAGHGRVLWAWLDLNQRPHPYQLNAGNRCADRPFPRSCSTVRAEGMRSIGLLVCGQPVVALPRADPRTSRADGIPPAVGHSAALWLADLPLQRYWRWRIMVFGRKKKQASRTTLRSRGLGVRLNLNC
jgi:hypothetical protein